jgi:hypothetical protein
MSGKEHDRKRWEDPGWATAKKIPIAIMESPPREPDLTRASVVDPIFRNARQVLRNLWYRAMSRRLQLIDKKWLRSTKATYTCTYQRK